MDVKLVMFKANGQRKDFTLSGPKVLVGRGTGCNLQIPLGTVSRKHCEITLANDKVKIKDLGSSNGTLVNDKRVVEVELAAGDKLVIGPVIFILSINGEPQDIKPIRTVIEEESVEPISHQQEGEGTIDAEAQETESSEANPLAALQALARKKK